MSFFEFYEMILFGSLKIRLRFNILIFCSGICEYYGDVICGPEEGSKCIQNPSFPSDFMCGCKPGYILINETCYRKFEY